MTVSMPTDSNGVSIKVGSVSAIASRPEPLDGSIDSSSNYAQYAGIGYKADGTPIYKKVGSSNRVVVTNAILSSEGVELI